MLIIKIYYKNYTEKKKKKFFFLKMKLQTIYFHLKLAKKKAFLMI